MKASGGFLLVLLFPALLCAGEPTEQLRASVDAVVSVLKDGELRKPENREARRRELRRIVDERFDFEEMAKRSLGRHWRSRSEEERAEFVPLYTDLLEATYLKKIERYEDEEIIYTGESVEGGYATVRTKVLARQGEIPITYRLLREGSGWAVYDVVVEGVSLVNNYRTQFGSIITSGSYGELVERVREKVEAQKKGG